ncbi:MAG: FAD-dependent oxidoreductase [Sphingomonadales bacterium]|nr:MAG: FAD-dependent oxidoreductase [Sphingomonadales bacterium]
MRTIHDVAILGAGVVGVSTAYWAAREGLSAIVVDARDSPAQETSFANGGQISVSHAEPWASPRVWRLIAPALFDPQASIRVRLNRDPRQWRWLLMFLAESLPARFAQRADTLLALAIESAQALDAMQQDLGFDAAPGRGILHLHDTAAEAKAWREIGSRLHRAGWPTQSLGPAEALTLEPALATGDSRLYAATYAPGDRFGDAHAFAKRLADASARHGVDYRYNSRVTDLAPEGGAWRIHTEQDGQPAELRARHVVVALGCGSAPLLARLGLSVPIAPAQGYSITVPIAHANGTPRLSVTDEANRLVISPLGDVLRVAGFLDLGWRDAEPPPDRIARMIALAQRRFPAAGDYAAARPWVGHRPVTPGNLPLVGGTGLPGLWLNAGHGTLGWTLAAGSARRLAKMLKSAD